MRWRPRVLWPMSGWMWSSCHARREQAKSADFIADGVLWEVKSPTSANLRVVQKHLRAALHQSRDVIFDCRRMKGAREEAVLKEVRKWAGSLASVRRLLFVDRSGGVLRIK